MSSQFQFDFPIVRIKFLDFFYLWMYLAKIRKSIEICKEKVSTLKPVPDRLTRVGKKRDPHSPHSLYFLQPPLYKSLNQATGSFIKFMH